MGEGRVVYLLAEGQAGRPEQVSTLGPTPVSHVGTVEDQDHQHQQWLRSRRTGNEMSEAKRGRSGRGGEGFGWRLPRSLLYYFRSRKCLLLPDDVGISQMPDCPAAGRWDVRVSRSNVRIGGGQEVVNLAARW